MTYLRYLVYVIRHKWFVLVECWRRGLYWRGFWHDWSKLRPSEFFPYARHFYGTGAVNPRDGTGYYKPEETGDQAFDVAWLLHQHRNDHHWQYWVLPGSDGIAKKLEMPGPAVLEMLCDWHGASRAQRTTGTAAQFYTQNKVRMYLHPRTRIFVEMQLGVRRSDGEHHEAITMPPEYAERRPPHVDEMPQYRPPTSGPRVG